MDKYTEMSVVITTYIVNKLYKYHPFTIDKEFMEKLENDVKTIIISIIGN